MTKKIIQEKSVTFFEGSKGDADKSVVNKQVEGIVVNIEDQDETGAMLDRFSVNLSEQYAARRIAEFSSKPCLNLLASVDELELSVRASNIMRRNQIDDLLDLVCCTESEFLQFRHCGRKTLREIGNELRVIGLRFSASKLSQETKDHIRSQLQAFRNKYHNLKSVLSMGNHYVNTGGLCISERLNERVL